MQAKSIRVVTLPLLGPFPSFEPFLTTYLLLGKKTALIDPGPTSCLPQLLSKLDEAGVKVESLDFILLTHIHIDHAGGVGDLICYCPKAKVIVHPNGAKHVAHPEKLWQASLDTLGEVAVKYGKIKPVPEERIISAVDGMKIDLGEGSLSVIFTPGHASHHQSFWDGERGELFVGDAVGVYHPTVDAITPGTPPPFDPPKALKLLEKLVSLKPKTICYSHGGCVPMEKDTLERHRKQLFIWSKVVSEMPNRELREVLEKLVGEDEELAKFTQIGKFEFERETFFLVNSVEGFASYFKDKASLEYKSR